MAEGVWSEGIYNDSSDVLMMKASQLNTSSRDLEETLGRSDEPATRAKKNKVKSRSLDIPFGSRGSSGSGKCCQRQRESLRLSDTFHFGA